MSINKNTNINYFTKLASLHGVDVKSVNWANKASQELRFEKLLQIGDLNQSTILDIGCGIGDMYEYLQKGESKIQYQGIDITPKMIELCKQRFPKLNDQFECLDILKLNDGTYQCDWVLASGIFYLLKENPLETSLELIHKMYSFSKKGIAFNSLSSWAQDPEQGEFYMDPLFLLSELKKRYPRLVFLHDYHPSDFTIYIYK